MVTKVSAVSTNSYSKLLIIAMPCRVKVSKSLISGCLSTSSAAGVLA